MTDRATRKKAKQCDRYDCFEQATVTHVDVRGDGATCRMDWCEKHASDHLESKGWERVVVERQKAGEALLAILAERDALKDEVERLRKRPTCKQCGGFLFSFCRACDG